MEDTLPVDFHTGDSYSAGSLAGEDSHIADNPPAADNLPAENHIADNPLVADSQVEEDNLPADIHQQVPAHKPAFPVQQRCR